MKLRLAPVAAMLLVAPAGVRAQEGPAPPPPPPPPASLLDATQAGAFYKPGTVLRYQFEPGQVRRYRIVSDTTSRLSASQQHSATIKQRNEMVLRETVQSISFPGGIATLILQPESFTSKVNDKETTISQDEMDAYLRQYAVQMAPTGQILAAASSDVHNNLDNANPLLRGFLQTQSAFPSSSVQPGDHWNGYWELNDLATSVTSEFSMAGVEKTATGSVVRIKATLSNLPRTQTANAQNSPATNSVRGRGEILFDNASGALAKTWVSLHAMMPAAKEPHIGMRQTFANSAANALKQWSTNTGTAIVDKSLTVVRIDDSAAAAQVAHPPAETGGTAGDQTLTDGVAAPPANGQVITQP